MYTITGVTGHVGAATADALLERGARVRAVVRDPARGAEWGGRGAAVAIADFTDRAALAEAMRGSDGAFVMLPTLPTGGDAEHRAMADSIAAAVADSGVGHVVLLSSIGADRPDGTGPIRWLHHLEDRLRDTGTVLTAIRSWHFQEKVETVLGPALGAGVYPVFGDSADVPTPMIATRDIGGVAADLLLAAPSVSEVVELQGPEYTERDVADRLGAALGRPLQIETIPREAWVDTLVGAGLPTPFARELAALYAAEQDGVLTPHGDRTLPCATPIDETLGRVLATVEHA